VTGPVMYADSIWAEIAALARDLKVEVLDNSADSDCPWVRKYELVFPDKAVIAFSTTTEVLAFLKGVGHGQSGKTWEIEPGWYWYPNPPDKEPPYEAVYVRRDGHHDLVFEKEGSDVFVRDHKNVLVRIDPQGPREKRT
jgi:hypothetical protein